VSGELLVFVPAWNEAENLPHVLEELARDLPEAHVLVVDDGSTDGTADVARAHGAEVVRFDENRGLPVGIAAGYRHALEGDYTICGRVDADGQHPVQELARLIALVRKGRCDVAVGSRYVSGDGYEPYRYRPTGARRFGMAVLRRALRPVLGRSFNDPTSGMFAAGAKALPLLAEAYSSGAPEVEALIRLRGAGLEVLEVPVDMRQRASGESKLRGKKAIMLVLTVAGAIVAGLRLASRRR
jgi:glycosyltransferase involved in cell wall biosynthesis